MTTPTCSKCQRTIPSEDVNVAQDVAYCRPCNLSYPLSALTRGLGIDAKVDLHRPPAGCWYRDNQSGTVIGATHRSVGMALPTLLFGLFWNGIVSVFVLLAVAGTLKHLDVAVPAWFPAPQMNGSDMSVGMTIFLWIFLTPFIAIGLGLVGAFLACIAGRTEVRIHNKEAAVFVGLGAMGFCRRFTPAAVRDVRIEDKQWRDSDGDRQRKASILIETRTGKQIKFGSMLTEERRHFVAGALRQALPRD